MAEMLSDNFIAASAADRLIAAHDGDVALLYIYIARTGSHDLEQAARDLCRTMRELTEAEEKLRRMGLLPLSGVSAPAQRQAQTADPGPRISAPPLPAEGLPEYRTEDIVRRSKEDGAFSVIVAEAAKVIGRNLSSSDMKLLFGVYDYLALPPEVILELMQYCAENYEERYGPSRRPTPKAIEKEAYIWANEEILTLEQAEEYIRLQKGRRSQLGLIKSALGIRDRELSATETKYVSSWLEMGFREGAVAVAYDRTVTNTGRLSWGYMNKILLSWHENGIHTPEEIEARDSRRREPARPQNAGTTINQTDLDAIRSFWEKKI